MGRIGEPACLGEQVDVGYRLRRRRMLLHRCAWVSVTLGVVAALVALPHRRDIAPIIETDNTYIFLAVDRMYEGDGPTALPVRMCLTSVTWRGDWEFLTEWPMGYPLLLYAARMVLGVDSVTAGVSLSVLGCGVALVGWFAWIKRCLPKRLPATLIALVATASTFSISNLVNPRADIIIIALVPLVLLLAAHGLGWKRESGGPERVSLGWMALLGLVAGALYWIRYAAIFVPVGIGLYLLAEWWVRRRVSLKVVVVYGISSLAPILLLVVINRVFGNNECTQYQLPPPGYHNPYKVNAELFQTMWSFFSNQTPYYYRSEQPWFFAQVLPIAGSLLPLLFSRSRQAMKAFLSSPPVLLSVILTAALLVELVAATALFGRHYYLVARHYQPIGPFYFLLFVGPLLTFKSRGVRAAACVPLVLACAWYVDRDACATYARRLAADRTVTDYGRRGQHFEPHSRILYSWLRAQKGGDLVVFSELPYEIAIETGIPACFIPLNVEEMNTGWLAPIARTRGIEKLRLLFVLDPSSERPIPEIVSQFGLTHPADIPPEIKQYVFVRSGQES